MAGSDNRLKTPLARSLNQNSGQRASDASQSLGKRIPARVVSRNGQVVTVAVEMQVGGAGGPWTIANIAVPISTSTLDWMPIDAGTQGYLQSSDFYLGGVSGQGGGTADYSQRGNLAAMVFHPVSNLSWMPPGGDTEKRVVQGPNGVLLQDTGGAAVAMLDKSSGVNISFKGGSIVIDSSGNVTITSSGLITLNGITWDSHTHDDPQGGHVGPPHN